MIFRSFAIVATLAALSAPAEAETNMCETIGSNGMVSLVLCPPGLEPEAWRGAGLAACEGRAPCGAWIWDDVAAMPESAPASHDKLSPEQVRAAKAIWVNDKNELMILETQ